MIEAIIFVKKGNMYVIGMDTEKPVYYPITMHELKQMIHETSDEVWQDAYHHSDTKKQDLTFPAENVMSVSPEE
jgi:hypothetical protein